MCQRNAFERAVDPKKCRVKDEGSNLSEVTIMQ
jgi:hypothetical protein